MKKYIQIEVKAGNQNFFSEMPLDNFEEKTGIVIDFDEDEEIDECTEEEIADYAVDSYSNENKRYNLGIECDAKIRYIGCKILNQNDEELCYYFNDECEEDDE